MTDLIPINVNETLYAFPIRNNSTAYHALFDKSGNFISNIPSSNESITNDTGEDCYVRFSLLEDSDFYEVRNDSIENPFVKFNPIQGYLTELEDGIFEEPVQYGMELLSIGASFLNNTTYNSSDYIRVPEGGIIKYRGQSGAPYPVLEIYDINLQKIKSGMTGSVIKGEIIKIEQDGYVRFQSYNETNVSYNPSIQFFASFSYIKKNNTLQAESTEIKLLTQETFSPNMSIKAFKELNYVDETLPNYKFFLWNDGTTDTFYISTDIKSARIKIFQWNLTLSEGKNSGAYSSVIMPNGDVLFVYRTEFAGGAEPSDSIRKNPILYVAANNYTPEIIDFGVALKPSGWLQNIGVHYSYRYDCLMIAEYARANQPKARIWRVSLPITDPVNWEVVLEKEISVPYGSGFKHFHTAQADPFNPVLYVSSGDGDTSAAVWYSIDGGYNFIQLDGYNRAKYRMLNMVFTKENVWWASDDWRDTHKFWKASRGDNGVIDPTSITEILTFPYSDPEGSFNRIATYSNVYLECFNAILFLDRDDEGTMDYIPLRIYDIDRQQLYEVANIYPSSTGLYGFRNECVTIYPKGNQVVVSFGLNYPNRLKILGNGDGGGINNLILNVF